MDRFLKNMTIWSCDCMGSSIAQKGCMITDVGIRNTTNRMVPIFTLYPSNTLNPPRTIIMPLIITRRVGPGTPMEPAYMAMPVVLVKCPIPDMINMSENRILPIRGMYFIS